MAYPYYYQPMQNNGLIWIQGLQAAKSYPLVPNSTVALWDSEESCVYLKSADASGMPSIKVLDYTIREAPAQTHENALRSDFATKEDISTLKAEIERIKEDLGYGKPLVPNDGKSAEQ